MIAQGEAGLAQITAGLSQAQEGYAQVKAVFDVLEDCRKRMQEIEAAYPESEYKDPLTTIGGQYAALESQAQQIQIQITDQKLDEERIRLEGTIAALKTKYDEIAVPVNVAKEQLEGAEQELADAAAELETGEAQLAGVPAQLADGQRQIQAGWAELSVQEEKLRNGESEIAENEAKLAEAEEELEEGRTKAAEELAEGEEKIADAEAEIEDIPEASWYIYDRSTLP